MRQSIQSILKSSKEWWKACLCVSLGVVFVMVFSFFCRVVISETDSLPEHYFLHFPFSKAQKGQYTYFWSPWYQGNIVKMVVGVEGDKVTRDKQECVWVNEVRIGIPKVKASDGSPLTPIKTQVIPKGYVFVYSSHENSFDSRYQELGIIPKSILQGRLVPLW